MKKPHTRWPFRVLAGLFGIVLLCFSLPIALMDAQLGFGERVHFVACCLVGGTGFLMASYTGRWFNSRA